MCGQAFNTGEPILSEVVSEPSKTFDYLGDDVILCSAAAVPLYHHGKLVGVFVVAHEHAEHFSETDLRLLRSVGEQAALGIRNAQLYVELRSYAQNLENMVEVRTQELRDAQSQLIRTEKLAALGRLAAGIAHEVNNPLQPIVNCLEVAIEDIEHGDIVDVEVLRVAEREVQRIKTIVSRLLDFARPSSVETTEIALHTMINEVLVLTRKQLERLTPISRKRSATQTGGPQPDYQRYGSHAGWWKAGCFAEI
jgi:C4-dicarboxylate-specific signal transduction histidine kinase